MQGMNSPVCFSKYAILFSKTKDVLRNLQYPKHVMTPFLIDGSSALFLIKILSVVVVVVIVVVNFSLFLLLY